MTLLEYIKKVNKDWDSLTLHEQIKLTLSFGLKYAIAMQFFEKIDGQHWRQN